MLRIMALYMAASFVSIYLYQLGYPVVFIAGFWAVFYLFKALISIPATVVVAWLGPKHATLLSNVLYIPSMAFFAMVADLGPIMLLPVLLFQGASSALYVIAYNVDFSKVKNAEHAGKEIAYMNIIEKITAGSSPLVGGILAFFFGPQVVLALAGLLFGLAAVPLLRTGEPVPPRQKISFKGFSWHLVRPIAVAQASIGFDVFTSGTVWSLYTAIFIIGIASSNEVYVVNGILMSVVLLAALASSYIYGRLIDRKRGKELMFVAALANALTHFFRPFAGSPVNVAALNVANEAATTGYVMSYHRAMYDNADLSGQRTLYIGVIDTISSLGAAFAAAMLALLVQIFGEHAALESFFYIAAGVALLVLTARFPMYRR